MIDTNRSVPSEERTIWSVTELVNAAREVLWEAFPFVWVRGEVSDFTRSAAGHWYLELKDEKSVLRVPMFRSDNEAVPFEVETGLELIVGGEVEIYQARSSFQLIARVLEPVGWGALQLAFEQLKSRLAEEGLFEPARKRPLPLLPRCVGVVTSPSAAAWRDMWRVWRKNEVPLRIVLAPAQVQGSAAADEIAAAIELLNRHGEADVMIVGRGGGSREDLWAFNDESVARAISASRIPVVSAVGHEIDQTIADLVADERAATPTAAAERVAASRHALLSRLESAERRARAGLGRALAARRTRLSDPGLQRSLQQPARLLTIYRQRIDDALAAVADPAEERFQEGRDRVDLLLRRLLAINLRAMALQEQGRLIAAGRRLRESGRRAIEARSSRLAATAGRVEALSPLGVLARGYAICQRPVDNAIVREAKDVSVGDEVRVRLARDTLECTVQEAREGPEPDAIVGLQTR